MGIQSSTIPSRINPFVLGAVALLMLVSAAGGQAANAPLVLPGALAFDASSNLFFAESGSHIIRRLSPDGVLSIVAGTGMQGFAGDGGPATAALLDTPAAVALDSSSNLFVADTHNHCIRRVDGLTGVITTYAQAGSPVALALDGSGNVTYADAAAHKIIRVDQATGQATGVAGDGTQGFAGDGGPAVQAEIDTPSGIAFDVQGNLYLADAHNHRIRRVDAATRRISTVAGNGSAGFSGDSFAASGAALYLPRGLSVDASGNLYIADSRNHRIRRVDGTTGQITTVAGEGTQSFLGDGSPAVSASLDSPRAVALSQAGLVTLTDSGNGRVRQVDANAIIHTLAGANAVGRRRAATVSTLTQTSPQALVCTVSAGQGTPSGSVTLVDATSPIASATLATGRASFSTASLSSGMHTLTCRYGGDPGFLPSTSAPLIVTVATIASAGFTIASTGPSTISVPAGSTATFAFAASPSGAPLSSEIVLAASGVPLGATGTFNPAYLPPPAGPVSFTLAIVAPAIKAQVASPWRGRLPIILTALLIPLLLSRRRRVAALAGLLLLGGCGDRTAALGTAASVSPVSYNITVNGTATLPGGGTLVQSAQVVLTVQ